MITKDLNPSLEPYATAWGRKYSLAELDAMTHWQIQRVFFLMRTYNIYMGIILEWYRIKLVILRQRCRIKLGYWKGLEEFIVGIRILFDI